MRGCAAYFGGCHPHAHAWIHGTHGGGGPLGALLFLALLGWIYDMVTQ